MWEYTSTVPVVFDISIALMKLYSVAYIHLGNKGENREVPTALSNSMRCMKFCILGTWGHS